MKKIYFAICSIFIFCISVQADEDLASLSQKIQNLQLEIEKINGQNTIGNDRVRTFFSQSMALGGFLENGMTSIWGPDTQNQFIADNQRLGLNISAELNSRIKVISQVTYGFSYPLRNEHNNPLHGSSLLPLQRSFGGITYGALLTQAYADYAFSDFVHLQSGLGYVPYGQSFQVREPVLFNKRRGPQIIRTSGVSQVIVAHPFWQGLNLIISPTNEWRVNFYTATPLDHSGKMGAGARVEYSAEQILTLGASYQVGEQARAPYNSIGADTKLDFESWGIQAEYGQYSTSTANIKSLYIQPYFKFFNNNLLIFLMADYLSNPIGQTTLGTAAVSDPYEKWENTIGAVYYILPNARLRLDYTQHNYVGNTAVVNLQDRDYNSVSLSTGVSF